MSEHLKKMNCREAVLFLGGHNCAGRSLSGDEFGLPVRRTGMEEQGFLSFPGQAIEPFPQITAFFTQVSYFAEGGPLRFG